MTNVLTLFNQKGGVGKSSLALNVAVEMSQRGYRVIAIDNDPQANLSSVLRGKKDISQGSLTRTLYEDGSPSFQQVREQLWITNADQKLSEHQQNTRGLENFAEIIRDVEKKNICDVIVIDCNPSLTDLTRAAILAGTHWLIPIKCERWSIDGLAQANQTIVTLSKRYPRLFHGTFLGFLVNQYKRNTQEHRKYRNVLRKKYPEHLFEGVVSDSIALATAQSKGMAVTEFKPNEKIASEIKEVTTEILNKMRD